MNSDYFPNQRQLISLRDENTVLFLGSRKWRCKY